MKITIVGMGLMGCSMARGLTKAGHTVYGVDLDEVALKYCEEIECIEKGFNDLKNILDQTELLVIAIYPLGVVDYIKQYKDVFPKGLIITDILGIKEGVVEQIQKLLPKDIEFIGGHPMAGREKSGAYHGDETIFHGANYIITPTASNNESTIKIIEELAEELHFGKVTRITTSKHDKMIAFTSQLTHAIAVSLVNSDKEEDTYSFTGDSYRDLTRIAMINDELWSELFLSNKDNLIEKIDDFQAKLGIIKDALETNNKEVLKQEFIKSTKKRKQLKPKKKPMR